MNLKELDEILDAIERPKYILMNQWLAEFLKSDKRKRGRMMRQKRKREAMQNK